MKPFDLIAPLLITISVRLSHGDERVIGDAEGRLRVNGSTVNQGRRRRGPVRVSLWAVRAHLVVLPLIFIRGSGFELVKRRPLQCLVSLVPKSTQCGHLLTLEVSSPSISRRLDRRYRLR